MKLVGLYVYGWIYGFLNHKLLLFILPIIASYGDS